MGEIADDYMEGRCCSGCMQYFVTDNRKYLATHGYPVLCNTCWKKWTTKERKSYQVAIFKEM